MKYLHQQTRNPFRITRALWRTLRNLEATRDVLILEEVYNNSRLTRRFSGWDRVAERLIPDDLSTEQLSRLPRLCALDLKGMAQRHMPGTVGHALANHMLENNLNPNIFRPTKVSSRREYVINHFAETHDVWHVVTGYGTDVPGELALIGFYAANVKMPIAALLLGLGLLNTAFLAHDQLGERMDAIVEGWNGGKQAKSLFAIDWQAQFDRPLDEFRHEMKLPAQVNAGTGIAGNWSNAA